MVQAELFGENDVADRKKVALTRALLGVTDEYKRKFLTTVFDKALSGSAFTSEDITFVVGLPHESKANKNNGVGALMAQAAALGLIHKTGRYVPAFTTRSNSRAICEWIGVGKRA